MNGESGATSSFDIRAVGIGILWGLGLMLAGSVVQGMVGFRSPLTSGTEAMMPLIWQAVGSLFSGLFAAKRASGSGWLHGAVSGIALVLAVGAVMGVASALPTMAVVLKMAGIGAGAGALGGIAGVNMSK